MTANNNHTNGIKASELSFDEAPASWNTKYVDPNGFECQITLRGESGSELLEKANNAIAYLLQNGCTPYVYTRYGSRPAETKPDDPKNGKDQGNGTNGTNGSNGTNSNLSWCPIHQCEMKRWERDGRVWYSHKADGEWCKGK